MNTPSDPPAENDIYALIMEILGENFSHANKDKINRDTALHSDGFLDSMEIMTFFNEIENSLKISIPTADIESKQLEKIDNLIEYLHKGRPA